VSFIEEDRTTLHVARWGVSKDFLWSHVFTPLSTHLELCGRYAEFVG